MDPSKAGAARKIEITLFGAFSIQVGENQINDSMTRTHQLWHLIEYLIVNRNKSVTQEELIDVLWPRDDIENPINALKNLVYRARTTLSSHGLPHAKEMIVYSKGGYRWNNSLPCVVDAEEFDRLCRLAQGLEPDKQMPHYLEAIRLYKGDFLQNARFETWVVPIASGYRSRFFTCVYTVLEQLLLQKRYGEMEDICRLATTVDSFEEMAHRYWILSLIRQGKQVQAMNHYSKVTDMFFRELGVSPSAAMRSLYREIAKTTHDIEVDLGIIKQDLEENDGIAGAFYCEYEVFKNLYRLEARTAVRTGQPIFVTLVTVEGTQGAALDVKLQNRTMDSLYEIIRSSLRKGDVFARFSACQYVMMLPALTYESCQMVMDRITKRFGNAHRNRSISITAKIQPLDPVDSDA